MACRWMKRTQEPAGREQVRMSFENNMRVMASSGSPKKGESRPRATGQVPVTPSRGRVVEGVVIRSPSRVSLQPVDCSMPSFSVPHHLPKFAQVHIHCISDIIQPSHHLTPSSPSAFNLSQHQGLHPLVEGGGEDKRLLTKSQNSLFLVPALPPVGLIHLYWADLSFFIWKRYFQGRGFRFLYLQRLGTSLVVQ